MDEGGKILSHMKPLESMQEEPSPTPTKSDSGCRVAGGGTARLSPQPQSRQSRTSVTFSVDTDEIQVPAAPESNGRVRSWRAGRRLTRGLAVEEAGEEDSGAFDDEDIGEEEVLWVPEDANRPRKGSRWDVNYLKRQFEKVCIEDLYDRYWVRLQRFLLVKLLLLLIAQNLTYLILYNITTTRQSATTKLCANLLISFFILLHISATVLVFTRRLYLRLYRYLGVVIWLTCSAPLYLKLLYFATSARDDDVTTHVDSVAAVFYVIFVTHTMLPFTRKVALLLGAVTALYDLALMGALSNVNVLAYVCANVIGFYHKHLTDIAHRHTFLDTRDYLENDIEYCRQKEAQNDMRENLLTKIIPNHLVERMQEEFQNILQSVDVGMIRRFMERRRLSCYVTERDRITPVRDHRSIIHDVIELHTDVSILFADIVSFTPLTSKLEPEQLVRTLNDLFGRFDKIAVDNKCLRIKLLGDCYYCVSGIPNPCPCHAENCVRMGLAMIDVIRDVRHEAGVPSLDMRIGIHSGSVYSGVIGVRKWQYDIWSRDVTIANHMESGGKAGEVHVTKATLDHLGGMFVATPGEGHLRDDFLKEENVETFFVQPKKPETQHAVGKVTRTPSVRRQALANSSSVPFNSLSGYMLERNLPAAADVNRRLEYAFSLEESRSFGRRGSLFQGILDAGRNLLEATTSLSMETDATKDITRPEEQFWPLTLQFRNVQYEKLYGNRRDSTYKFYIYCSLLIFIMVAGVQLLSAVRGTPLYITLALGVLIYLTLAVFTTGLKNLWKDGDIWKQDRCRSWILTTSGILISNWKWKCLLFAVSTLTIFTLCMIPVISHALTDAYYDMNKTGNVDSEHATDHREDDLPGTNFTTGTTDSREHLVPCLFAPYHIFSCMVALVACSVFLRVSHLVKLVLMTLGFVGFNLTFHVAFGNLFEAYDEYINYAFLPVAVRGSIYISVIFLTLIVLDRQLEQNLRLDFLCRMRLQEEKDDQRRKQLYNELLLVNIIPYHVADHYLQGKIKDGEIYHQYCRNACVMFAVMPNFFQQHGSSNKTFKDLLLELHEIISAFDQLTMKKNFEAVEKMKVISSTYMAATGLADCSDTTDDDVAAENANLMVDYASAMFDYLGKRKGDIYQLRIGMAHGPVVAGVVGASKPHYDIWGDTVNRASRMEMHGHTGRIQVPEATAKLLMEQGVQCTEQGTVDVKGLGPTVVYLVRKRPMLTLRHSVCLDPANLIFNEIRELEV